MNSVNLLRYHKYWNYENKRIEIQELNICEKCIEKDEKEPEHLLHKKKEEDIKERLNGPVDEIIIQNQKEDNNKIRNEILAQLGIKPITLKDDDYENEKNQIIVQKIEQVIEERIIKKENAPKGLEYYRTAYDCQQKQLESLKQEQDSFIKRQ